MKELVIISGKGGTGKTSISACFAVLAKNAVIADCDVDASNLHILLKPEMIAKQDFFSGKEAVINKDKCIGCGRCISNCRFDAIKKDKHNQIYINDFLCEGCGVCVRFCPLKAIDFNERLCGEIMISKTRAGFFVDARMEVGAENSGKLVASVREEAKKIAKEEKASLIIVDGPPGIGCPAIASITGATEVLLVAEPTVSGFHDLLRVLELVNHFKIPSFICVNRWDINPEMTLKIENEAKKAGAKILSRISYDNAFSEAQIKGLAVVEIASKSANEINKIWQSLNY